MKRHDYSDVYLIIILIIFSLVNTGVLILWQRGMI